MVQTLLSLRKSMIVLPAIFLIFLLSGAEGKTREEIADQYKWNLADIYKTRDNFVQARKSLEDQLPQLDGCKGKLGDSAQSMKQCMDILFGLYENLVKLEAYAQMHYDENLKNQDAQKDNGETSQLGTLARERAAWVTPEIQAVGKARVDQFLAAEQGLSIYRQVLRDTLRQAEHTLSPQEEELLSRTAMFSGAPYNIYAAFTNSDMQYPKVRMSDGAEIEMTPAAYTRYRAVSNREDRKNVFDQFWKAHSEYQNLFGVMLNAQLQRDWFYAKSRKYNSSVEAALGVNNVPRKVYTQLIEDLNHNLDSMFRYLKLRTRLLELDQMHYYDIYPPLVKEVDIAYSYEDAQKLVLNAMKPLGEEYRKVQEQSFTGRWIDVYPTEGKRSGAYSNGAVYAGHPYMLLNYNDDYESISTLAHELGHAMHSYFSNKTQAYPTADYSIFVAEVASTFNEIILNDYLVSQEKDPYKRLFLLGNYLERFRQTVFRQGMFAEFELQTHELAENGKTLTGEDLTKIYLELLKKYHGHAQGVCEISDDYGIEWAYIPHFYYNFYVYQYATGQIASTALAEKVLAGEPGAVDAYLTFLKSGSSDYPIEVLKKAGVDLTSPEPFAVSMRSFNRTMDKIEAILKEIEAMKK